MTERERQMPVPEEDGFCLTALVMGSIILAALTSLVGVTVLVGLLIWRLL